MVLLLIPNAFGQVEGPNQDSGQEQVASARFLQLLRQRPRGGTALDRVFETLIVRTNPNSWSFEDLRGRIERLVTRSGDARFREAATEMERLVSEHPTNRDFMVRWGELALHDTENTLAERRTEAATIWRRLLELDQDEPATCVRVADLLSGI